MFPNNLQFFRRSEFRHPDLMNVAFLRWLDRVRGRSGVPMEVLDDGRLEGDPEPSGSAGTKALHYRGCAVDLNSRKWDARQKWQVVAAIVYLSNETPDGWKVEFEPVFNANGDHHWHLGLDWTLGKHHEFVESDD